MLNSAEIRRLIEENQLVSNYIDIEVQLQPSGFDLSLGDVLFYKGSGSVDFSNVERIIASTEQIKPDHEEWYTLKQGCYIIIYNEVVKIPLNVVAMARSRSTMLRNGAAIETAIWDPGYEGRSSSLLVVHNSNGLKLKRNARVVQLVFFLDRRSRKRLCGNFPR